MKILLADDEPTNRRLAVAILEYAGHAVVQCEDGEAALALIAVESFDVLVIDLVMPRLDGFSTIETLRQRDVRTPILVVSAALFEESRRRALEVGADGFLGKPYRRAELTEAIVTLAKGMVRSDARGPSASPWGG